MPDRKASVDVFWRSKEGYEMHLQLGGASSEEVLDDAQGAIATIAKSGGEPRPANGVLVNGTLGKEETNEGEKVSKTNPPKCSVCGKKMNYREGESRAGKPYKGFFCPESDCEGKPVWLND
jgi:hypothetical protein